MPSSRRTSRRPSRIARRRSSSSTRLPSLSKTTSRESQSTPEVTLARGVTAVSRTITPTRSSGM
ncbi:MAG: hypothetical protein R3A52_18085 [Polyangiales bacterium]